MMTKIFNLVRWVGLLFFSFFLILFLYFKITAPEGCSILQHYYFGNGKPLELKSDYLPNSPVIKMELKRMKVGQTKVITFKQYRDWRLSYALNPFSLTKLENGFDLHQFIKFDTKGAVYTYINIGFFKFKVKDNWVHFLKTTPFTVYYHYRNH